MKYTYVYLPVEVKSRELTSRLYLASKFLQQGVPVLIGRYIRGNMLNRMFSGTPISIWKGLNSSDAVKLQEDSKFSFIGLLDEEGFLVGDLDTYADRRYSEQILEKVFVAFTWGEAQSKILAARFPQWADKIVACSNPRVDLWKNRGFSVYKAKVNEIRRQFGDFLLIASNLGAYTNFEYVCNSINHSVVSSDKLARQNAEIRIRSEKLFYSYMSLIKKIVRETDLKIVVRPHPIDNDKVWANAVKDLPRVSVISEGDAAEWILSSKALIHNCCSTGAEAYFSEIPVISFCPDGLSLYKDNEVNSLGTVCTSEQEVLRAIVECNGLMRCDSKFIDNLVHHKVSSVDKITVCVNREASFVMDFRVQQKEVFLARAFDRIKDSASWLKTNLATFGANRRYRMTLRQKFPKTEKDQILEILRGLTSDEMGSQIRVKPILKNLFLIFPT
jgi:surface carbohydrate biosynthesis protein